MKKKLLKQLKYKGKMMHTQGKNDAINIKSQKNRGVCVTKMNQMAKYNLHQIKMKQGDFRVAKGISTWTYYNYQDDIDLREILNSEIAIEFDFPESFSLEKCQSISYPAVNFTAINLLKGGFTFEIYDHSGKSPHIHIRNLPIEHLSKGELREFKKFFIKKYVPEEFLDFVDYSLTGIHMIALEYENHWKNKYGIKQLLHKFTPEVKGG